jgi:anti-sigma factor RsiW
MCPDRQILSVYLDGELLAPWKEKMERHLETCPDCRRRLELWRRLTAEPERGAAEENAALEAAHARVLHRLEGTAAPRRGAALWRRRVSIPLPAAAAAALALFIALAALAVRRPAEPAAIPTMLLTSGEMDAPAFSDLTSVVQYLSGANADAGDVLILRLPESRNFVSSGEPAIIKAADYARSSRTGRRP